ncbi:MAG TPA: hypothetical protein VFT85_05475 [Acidimicrobiia bacterium]|nr:hypothetical protein [Acidimicrobiia bacterium]
MSPTGPPPTIVCVECGGTAHLITYLPTDGSVEPGYPVAYRCADCMDRFDVVWENEED